MCASDCECHSAFLTRAEWHSQSLSVSVHGPFHHAQRVRGCQAVCGAATTAYGFDGQSSAQSRLVVVCSVSCSASVSSALVLHPPPPRSGSLRVLLAGVCRRQHLDGLAVRWRASPAALVRPGISSWRVAAARAESPPPLRVPLPSHSVRTRARGGSCYVGFLRCLS